MTARTLAPVLPLVLASAGCLVLDGFGDLEPRADAATTASSTTSEATTSTGAGGGDGGAGSTGSTGTGGSTSSGGGGGGSGPGDLEQVGSVVRFGATGSAGCRTRVTDVLRVGELTLVTGVTWSSSGPCEIVPLEADGEIDFGKGGGIQSWIAAIGDDDEVLRILRLEYADALGADVSGTVVDVVPPRLHRMDGQAGPIVTRSTSWEGVQAEVRVGRFDPTDLVLEPLATLTATEGDGAGPTAVATEVIGDGARLTVVGALQAHATLTASLAGGDVCEVLADFGGFDHAFRWSIPTDGGACPVEDLPAFAVWSAVTEGDQALVALGGPTAEFPACRFGDVAQAVARTSADLASCSEVVATYAVPDASTPFSIALAGTDEGSVVAVREGDELRFGPLPDPPHVLAAVPGIVDLARLRGAGSRHVVGGWFGGALELDGQVVLENDGSHTDGFVAIATDPGGAEPLFIGLGGALDDEVTSVDVEPAPDGILVVSGTYGAPNPTLGVDAPLTAGASYVIRYRLEAP